MDTEFSIFDVISLKIVIERCKSDSSFAKRFYDYLEQLVKPVYYSIMKGSSNRAEFLEMLNECIEDVYMFIVEHNSIVYTNFESFIRKRFEFYILNKRSAFLSNSNRNKTFYEEIEETLHESKTTNRIYVEESVESVIEFMANHKEEFTLNDRIIIAFYSKGYNLNEISQLVGFSYGKTKASFESVIFKLKNYFRY